MTVVVARVRDMPLYALISTWHGITLRMSGRRSAVGHVAPRGANSEAVVPVPRSGVSNH